MSNSMCEVENCTRIARVLLEFPDKTRVGICDNHAVEAIEWGREHNLAMPITFYEKLNPLRLEEYMLETNTKRPRLFGPTGKVQK